MSENQNQLSGWARSWIIIGREQPGGDWIIQGNAAVRVGALLDVLPLPNNDNHRRIE